MTKDTLSTSASADSLISPVVSTPTTVSSEPSLVYATFSRRLGAFILDFIICYVASFISIPIKILIIHLTGNISGELFLTVNLAVYVAIFFLNFVYFTGKKGYTWGKYLLHLRVTKENNNEPPGIKAAFLREFVGKGLEYVTIPLTLGVLGYLSMCSDTKRQAFHDKLAKTLVIQVLGRQSLKGLTDAKKCAILPTNIVPEEKLIDKGECKLNPRNSNFVFQLLLNFVSFFVYLIFILSLYQAGLIFFILLTIYFADLIFYLSVLALAIRSKIVFKDETLVVKRLYQNWEIHYNEIDDVKITGPFNFYFSLYKIIFPFTQLFGIGQSGFVQLILANKRKIEIPLLFDAQREKMVLEELRLKAPQLNTSKDLGLVLASPEGRQRISKFYRNVVIFMIAAGIIILAMTIFNAKKQNRLDEMTLPDGSKQFAYDFTRYEKGRDYAEWAIYYPDNYFATNITSDLFLEDLLDYVTISRNPCCVNITVTVRRCNSTSQMNNFLERFSPDKINGGDTDKGDLFWYQREVEKTKMEIGRVVRSPDKENWIYVIRSISNEDSYELEKNEIISIVESFEFGNQNLKSNKLKGF